MNRFFVRATSTSALIAFLFVGGPALTQERPNLAGMYSDPQDLVDFLCLFWCSDAGTDYLNALLDDPANDDRSIMELYIESAWYQYEEFIKPHLTPAGMAALGRDPADDPGFLSCIPWAFAWEIFAPHHILLTQHDDRVDILYGEWEVSRTVYMDGRGFPADLELSPMGYSIGRYEGDTLVVETRGIEENFAPWGTGFFPAGNYFDGRHSDQLTAVERFSRTDDGQRLLLEVTFEDPWALSRPLTLNKVWNWAPDQEIGPYEDCEIPTDFIQGAQ